MASRAQRRSPALIAFSTAFVAMWLIAAAFPFLWTAWGSLKVEADFFSRTDWMNAITGPVTIAQTGSPFTGGGYWGAWVEQGFWKAVINTAIVVVSVVCISLTLGTLGGYALARSGFRYTFWILIAALVFRAMPHVTLVSGYLLPFFELNIWGYLPTTIIVLVAINQPFTLWMLHSFFLSIPKDLDESALVDGCTRFQAFRHGGDPGDVAGGDHHRALLLPARLQRLHGDRAPPDPGEPDDGAEDRELSRLDPGRGQGDVRGGGGGVGDPARSSC